MSNENKYASGPEAASLRESKDLKVGLVEPRIQSRPMPTMSEDELYLRLNVPQGLETDGSRPTRYGIVQHAHKGESDTSIKTDNGR